MVTGAPYQSELCCKGCGTLKKALNQARKISDMERG
jgi:hypothetical protein